MNSEVELKYGKQHFDTEEVEVYVNDEIKICKMFQDSDGDLGFLLDGKQYYFRYCQRINQIK